MILKSCIVIPADGPRKRNTQRPLTKLIKFVVDDSSSYVNLRSRAISVSEVETVKFKWLKIGSGVSTITKFGVVRVQWASEQQYGCINGLYSMELNAIFV